MSDDNNKYHKRTLRDIDSEGRARTIRIVYDLDAMLRDAFPELKEDYEKRQAEKKPGDLIPIRPTY